MASATVHLHGHSVCIALTLPVAHDELTLPERSFIADELQRIAEFIALRNGLKRENGVGDTGASRIDYSAPWALLKTIVLAMRAVPLCLGLGSALLIDGLTGDRLLRFLMNKVTAIAVAVWAGMLPNGLDGAWLGFVVMVLVIVGGMITAACSSYFAGGGLPTGTRALLRRVRLTFGALLLPTGACCLLVLLPILAASCWQAGSWWQVVAYVLAVPAMISGMMLLVLGPMTLMAWPLIVAAVAIEQTDEFGAFSRAVNYTTGQPLRLSCYAIPMTCLIGVGAFASLQMTDWLAAGPVEFRISGFALGLLVDGLLISWGWCSVGTIYLLLRQAEDGLPLDAIPQPVLKDFPDHLPVVGLKRTAG